MPDSKIHWGGFYRLIAAEKWREKSAAMGAPLIEALADLARPRPVPWNWPGEPAEVWEYARSVSVPFRALLDCVPEKRWPEINPDVHAAIRRYADQHGVHLSAVVVMASGTK